MLRRLLRRFAYAGGSRLRALMDECLRYFFQLQSLLNKEFYLNIKVEELILSLGCWEDVLPTSEFVWPEVKE